MTLWVFATMGLVLVWTFIFWLARTERDLKNGAPPWKKKALLIGSCVVCVLAMASGAAMWISYGSFHPVFLIVIGVGLMAIDLVNFARKIETKTRVKT